MNNETCLVKCNVCECAHNGGCNCCTLERIEITHEKTGENAISVPHFCKSFKQK